MGKIGLGILDGVSGKVGNVVGASWKGIDYIRAKATNRKDAKTSKQLKQRSRFKGLSDFAKPLLPHIIRPIWNQKADKMTGMNMFTKKNMPAFGVDGEIEDFSKLVFSIGSLDNPYGMEVVKNQEMESGVSIVWDELDPDNVADDMLLLVAISEDGSQLFTSLKGEMLRSEGNADVELPFDEGTEVHLYVFFADEERREFSPSQYFAVSI